MACDIDTIIADARCLQCKIPPGMEGPVLLTILCAIRDGETISCDPDELVESARCLQCKIPDGYMMSAIIGVACQIPTA